MKFLILWNLRAEIDRQVHVKHEILDRAMYYFKYKYPKYMAMMFPKLRTT